MGAQSVVRCGKWEPGHFSVKKTWFLNLSFPPLHRSCIVIDQLVSLWGQPDRSDSKRCFWPFQVREREARAKYAALQDGLLQYQRLDSTWLEGLGLAHQPTSAYGGTGPVSKDLTERVLPFHYGTHYSSSAVVLHYLVRLRRLSHQCLGRILALVIFSICTINEWVIVWPSTIYTSSGFAANHSRNRPFTPLIIYHIVQMNIIVRNISVLIATLTL